MLQVEKKYLSNGINADDAPFAVDKAELINAVNHRFGSSEEGAIGYNESVPGNVNMPSSYFPLLGGFPLGSAMDEVNNRLIVFFYNNTVTNTKGQIFCVELSTGTVRLVLGDSQVTGGLGFDPFYLINDGFVVNGKVYWTNNFSQPGCVNIDAGIKFNDSSYSTSVRPYTTLDQNTIRIIKKTQNLPLQVRKVRAADIPAISTYTADHISDNAYQFFVKYRYREYEESVIGPFSKLIGYNYKDSLLNVIEIIFDSSERIHEDIDIIQLGVRYNNIGSGFIIREWDRKKAADLSEINAHNNSGIALKYYFTGAESGTAVDVIDLNKPYESVPLQSGSLAAARNRLFLADNLIGYTAPVITSLAVAAQPFSSSGGLLGKWYTYVVGWVDNGGFGAEMPALFIDLGVGVTGRYIFSLEIQKQYGKMDYGSGNYVGYIDSSFYAPNTITGSQVTIRTDNLADISVLVQHSIPIFANLTTVPFISIAPVLYVGVGGSSVMVTNPLTLDNSRGFKGDSGYKVGIVFLDEDRRKCGVVTKQPLRFTTPIRTYGQAASNQVYNWSLSNTNAINEIPDWAYYYSIVRTKNLTTDFFFQGHSTTATYVTKDSAGAYVYSTPDYNQNVYAIGINIADMITAELGYVFAAGDKMQVWIEFLAQTFSLSVVGQSGSWIFCAPKDIGNLQAGTKLIFELYTPRKESLQEVYYEVGNIYAITNPGKTTRKYTVLGGQLNGDISLITRRVVKPALTIPQDYTYQAEAMSPNDKYWKNWWTDVGWGTTVDNIGQQRLPNNIAWSNVIIPGTKSNGLSSFDALDVKDTPQESGEINKLILASKVQEEGSVMLSINRSDTYSLYLGETQIVDSGGTVAYTATSTGIIGTINLLKGGYGTVHPESVKEYRGNIFWFDLLNAKVIQYSTNGLFPISDYKMTKFFRKFARRYAEVGTNYPIIGGIDPTSEEYLLSMLETETTGYAPNLPTLSIPNEFDLYDGRSKTFGFKISQQKFMSIYPFYYQWIANAGTTMFSFMQGRLFKHSETLVPDNFFDGVQYTTKLMFVANKDPNKPKVYSNIAIEANMAPTNVVFYSTDPYEQITDLVAGDFFLKEGVYYANLFRDRLSPNVSGTAVERMYKGDKIRSSALKVMLEFNVSAKKLQLKFVNIGYHISQGHST